MSIDARKAIRVAKEYGYKQLVVNDRDKERMVSFRHPTKCGGVRVNVYFTTGTVATCLDHPHQGYTQLFRRNMTLQDLEEILSDPRTHTKKGYHRIGNSGAKFDQHRASGGSGSLMYGFNTKHTQKFFGEVTKKNIDSITLGCDSFVILYTDGDTAWSGIPKQLKNKLKQRQSWLPKPEIIALGERSSQTYFIQYADGQQQWNDIPDHLEKDLLENDGSVDLIFVGDGSDYYVRFQDGTESWRGLPVGLSNLLNGRNGTRSRGNPNLAEVIKLSWSGDEWIVGFADGKWKWNSEHCSQHKELDVIFDENISNILTSCEEIFYLQMCSGNVVLSYKK